LEREGGGGGGRAGRERKGAIRLSAAKVTNVTAEPWHAGTAHAETETEKTTMTTENPSLSSRVKMGDWGSGGDNDAWDAGGRALALRKEKMHDSASARRDDG
jgi:hypothetical protein